MGVHLLVIGNRDDGSEPSDKIMDLVAERARDGDRFHVARCIQPADLSGIMSHARGNELIDLLDIFDHGRSGFQRLGSSALFESDDDPSSPLQGAAIAKAMIPHLSDVAHVRLLGCGTAGQVGGMMMEGVTATQSAGRYLLCKLAKVLGGRRVVSGTIRSVDHTAFEEGVGGFKRELEEDYLFSSLAAVDGDAPSPEIRIQHIRGLRPWKLDGG